MTCKGVTFRLAKGSHLDSRAQSSVNIRCRPDSSRPARAPRTFPTTPLPWPATLRATRLWSSKTTSPTLLTQIAETCSTLTTASMSAESPITQRRLPLRKCARRPTATATEKRNTSISRLADLTSSTEPITAKASMETRKCLSNSEFDRTNRKSTGRYTTLRNKSYICHCKT